MELNLVEIAIEFTKADFIRYRGYLQIIKNDVIPLEMKKEGAAFVKRMNEVIEKYKKRATEKDFIIFYNLMVLNKPWIEVSKSANCHQATVGRRLPVILHDFANLSYFKFINAELLSEMN